MAEVADRGVWLGPESVTAHRADLAAFVERAVRLDAATVVRLHARSSREFTAWVSTGLDVLASRVVAGVVRPDDLSVGADELSRGLAAVDDSGYVDPGFPMDSAWRGALPPDSAFTHLDDVPARLMLDLAQRGSQLAKEHGSSQGPPTSLLDQEVVRVSGGDDSVGVPMRCVFALTAMGFLPADADAVDSDEIVRVRVLPAWLRIDARFGSVYRRRGDPAVVLR
ncbi:hypothetical protein PT015_08795 [Candidatus Mycobacterium wuenschmannii]|uniref:Uncharacterized protein n=1 Tax=Candidatus Mycobacterium wuenschmannii TaxID=3027808 RepID=A0ABY8W6U5_9MYCO|nr:hypothetical protein [Candidatus Mycobacterium wuenschmannii]WIM89514.1 hypothetical protein PT015_08795 [Candidatus Mycobacterium wuenschmannii]